ncbi:carbohydrate ABC transporter permease [Alicyclobacillus fastidiosus]|uniref:Carbohydrate ABC transporter permease n=1 Tax=Alicyclobacillus fastidiosus TaxID=392011 RepID=A0ABY6ZAN9_9BACL|nr:carbohydrate ABC transporter permease [Alicyclobacillus fastidiosus]WAH39823.1 carbohydrate ABC transporter permease [Alicyclobacillus fastidiosus]GMA61080.1 sugar ABC transporter permease [Alicyclobacillus fastidiosus]
MTVAQKRWGQGIYFVVALICVAILVFPMYWMIVSSLKTNMQLFASNPAFYPPTPQWGVYGQVLSSQWTHLVTSLIIAFGVVILSLLIASPAAFALAHFRLKGISILLLALLIVQMVPGVSLANALFVIFHKLGLLNNYFGIILADSTYAVPFCVLILRAFMLSIPHELMESAFVDGGNNWTAFLRIVLPIAKPALVTASLFAFLFSWGDFLFALTMTTSNRIEPVTLAVFQYSGQYGNQWGPMMAFAVIASIPAALILIFSQRFITAGISSSGLKG